MGGANGSRECAPDDKLRDTHQLLFMASMGIAKGSTHPAPADPWSLVDLFGRRFDVGDAVKRHKPARRFAWNWRKNRQNAAIGYRHVFQESGIAQIEIGRGRLKQMRQENCRA
jgi:hypothetical protein